MDEFDTLNEPSANNNTEDEDLFSTDFTTSANVAAASSSTNPFANVEQSALSWTINNDVTDTSAPTKTNNFLDDDDDDDSFPVTSSNDNFFVDQSQSFVPPTVNQVLNNDLERRSSDYSLSSDSMPRFSSSSNNLSVLETFNQRRQQEIAELDATEKRKIDELRQQGKRDLERWYEDRRLQMEQKRQSMQQEQDTSLNEALKKSDKQSCDWAKVIRFLDFSQGTQLTKQKRDLNRMRAVIIQAKYDRENSTLQNSSE